MDILVLRRFIELELLAVEDSSLSGFIPAHIFTNELPLNSSVRFIDLINRQQLWMGDQGIYGLSDLFTQEVI